MARYSIEDTTLTALGDAVRDKTGKLTRPVEYTTERWEFKDKYAPNEASYQFFPKYLEELVSFNKVKIKLIELQGLKIEEANFWNAYSGNFTFDENNEYIAEGPERNYITFTIYPNISNVYYSGIFEFTAYLNDVEVVIAKTTMTNTMTPGEMIEEINGITPGPTAEELTITGNCNYRFAYDGWNWFIEKYGDKISSQNIQGCERMFYYSNLTNIPFDLNFALTAPGKLDYMFTQCGYLTSIPKIVGVRADSSQNMFQSCHRLRELDWESVEGIDWSYIDGMTNGYSGNRANTFASCYSLRSFPMELLNHGNPKANYSYGIYKEGFKDCYALDEIINLPVIHREAPWNNLSAYSNPFSANFDNCYRLKNMTFALQEDGSPYVCDTWGKGVVIDLSKFVGYGGSSSITGYNSGITKDKEVTDDATYQALKDDPDWFTTSIAYSRYNHDSAVATINSLPDCSTLGGCVIRFKGEAGSATDGGAISNLTEDEIAVATAKGWTVTLV